MPRLKTLIGVWYLRPDFSAGVRQDGEAGKPPREGAGDRVDVAAHAVADAPHAGPTTGALVGLAHQGATIRTRDAQGFSDAFLETAPPDGLSACGGRPAAAIRPGRAWRDTAQAVATDPTPIEAARPRPMYRPTPRGIGPSFITARRGEYGGSADRAPAPVEARVTPFGKDSDFVISEITVGEAKRRGTRRQG